MIQTHIFITETFVDQTYLAALLAFHFFEKNSTFDSIKLTKDEDDLIKKFESYMNTQSVILANLDGKKDYKKQLLSFYSHYEKPTLLFLGNISDYSIELQEGMLRLLEEPPANIHIILTCHTKQALLPTISSRARLYNLPSDIIFTLLNKSFLETVKKKLPLPLDTAKKIIHNSFQASDIKEISKLDRQHISLWLWQVGKYLDEIYKNQPSILVAKSIEKVMKSSELNRANTLKKLIFTQLEI
jgi:hypothetical protein